MFASALSGKKTIGLGLALSTSMAAAYLVHGFIKTPPPPPPVVEAPAVKTVQILAANKDIPFGKRITADDLSWQSWPENNLSPQYIKQTPNSNPMSDLAGAIAKASFVQGEPILGQKLAQSKGGYMSSLLAPGMRAISVLLTPETSVNGFVMPGDYVDVMMTAVEKKNGGDFYSSTRVVQSVQVVAIDEKITSPANANTIPGRTATLAVSDAQAEVISVAQRLGTLSLVLRSSADDDKNGQSAFTCDARVGPRTAVTVYRYNKPTQVPDKLSRC
jgi:pilus assembly protein CpaB